MAGPESKGSKNINISGGPYSFCLKRKRNPFTCSTYVFSWQFNRLHPNYAALVPDWEKKMSAVRRCVAENQEVSVLSPFACCFALLCPVHMIWVHDRYIQPRILFKFMLTFLLTNLWSPCLPNSTARHSSSAPWSSSVRSSSSQEWYGKTVPELWVDE